MSDSLPVTERSRAKRVHERARYDREALHGILDANPPCHVGYLIDGAPYVTPTFQWREGEAVYWHGSSASRFLRQAKGMSVCLTVSRLTGYVLARSGFHHSANYDSVMLFGEARLVADDMKEERLRNFTEALYPGRWETLRPVSKQELKATTILWMPIEEGSAKARTGQPVDDDEDYALPIWAGVIPVETVVGTPQPDPRNLPDLTVPGHVKNFSPTGKRTA